MDKGFYGQMPGKVFMVNWSGWFKQSDYVRADIKDFVRGEVSLSTLRSLYSDPDARRNIYALERMGVHRARNAARKALSRNRS